MHLNRNHSILSAILFLGLPQVLQESNFSFNEESDKDIALCSLFYLKLTTYTMICGLKKIMNLIY